MKTKSILTGILAIIAAYHTASAATVLAAWNFETNTPADLTNSATGPAIIAENGAFAADSSLVGVHTSANTDWTTPAGNGSVNSYSTNTWTIGDYFGFSTKSTGYSGITVSFDQIASDSGPRDFKLQFSIDGSTFTDVSGGTYALVNKSWNSTTSVSGSSYQFDLSTVTSLNDDSSLWFRLTQNSSASVLGGVIAAGGTSKIDNLVISAANTIPEPSSAIIGSLALLRLLHRRRPSISQS